MRDIKATNNGIFDWVSGVTDDSADANKVFSSPFWVLSVTYEGDSNAQLLKKERNRIIRYRSSLPLAIVQLLSVRLSQPTMR